MLLADARLPTGAHTQSAGLEPALRGGLEPSDVPSYIRARLRTVTAVEAGAAVVARARTVDAMTAPRGRADQLAPPVTRGARANEFGRAVEDDPRGQGAVEGDRLPRRAALWKLIRAGRAVWKARLSPKQAALWKLIRAGAGRGSSSSRLCGRWTPRGGPGRSAPRCGRRRCCSAGGTPGWSAGCGRTPPARPRWRRSAGRGARWCSALRPRWPGCPPRSWSG